MIFDRLPRPLIIAHRGASAYAPENTLASFNLAIEQQADAIELDVKLSADGVPVIIHDASVDRTTDGHGKVAKLTLAELRQLDAGSFFSETFRGEKIPTLEEVFEAVGKRIPINVELTNYYGTANDNLASIVAACVERHALQEWVFFSSFFLNNLKIAHRLLPKVPCALLGLPGFMGLFPSLIGWRDKSVQALNPHLGNTSPKLIQRMHQHGKSVRVWNVNTGNDMRLLRDWGVDGIFTDDPLLARRVYGREA
jgi:glycerophosphoryl diester phosphodiesterase